MRIQTDSSVVEHEFHRSVSSGSSIKRPFDICFVSVALFFLAPFLLLLIAAMLIMQGRPIIYRQTRLGLNGEHFGCLKFRSMVRNADQILQNYLAENPQAAAEWEATHKLIKDPRITRLGHFLRRSSFDELPQLWNVLKGDMSLVGPRPIVTAELSKFGEYASRRLSVRPGLTGLWQVSGRSNLPYEAQIQLDIQYIDSWSFSGDLILIAKTVPAVLFQRGAV